MKEWIESANLKEVCEKVIKDQNIDVKGVQIGYFLVSPNVSKRIAGCCVKTNDRLKFFSTYDYIIEMSQDVWNKLDNEKKEILAYHELLHINIIRDEKTGEIRKLALKDHNVKDFREVIEQYGIDWINFLEEIGQTNL